MGVLRGTIQCKNTNHAEKLTAKDLTAEYAEKRRRARRENPERFTAKDTKSEEEN